MQKLAQKLCVLGVFCSFYTFIEAGTVVIPQEVKIGLSETFAQDAVRVLKGLGTQTNENATDFLTHVGKGLEDGVTPGFTHLIKNSGGQVGETFQEVGVAVNKTMDGFFNQVQVSVPKVGPAIESIGNSVGRSMVPARNQILKGVAGVSGVILTAILLKHIGTKYIARYLFQPALVDKRSTQGIIGRIGAWFTKPIDIRKQMVISDQLAQDLTYIMNMTKNTKQNGGQFENILLHGVPGTGKTLFAQLLAQNSGMDFALIPAANVSQFLADGSAVEKLNELFAWASSGRNGTILFFDEAETFLASRSTLPITAQNALSAFLAKTGTPSNKIMIICATNRPEILDSAVLSRLNLRVEFPLPDLKARQDQLVMHVADIFGKPTGKKITYSCLQDKEYLAAIAQRLEGFSGRTIRGFVNSLYQRSLAENLQAVSVKSIDYLIEKLKSDKLKIA